MLRCDNSVFLYRKEDLLYEESLLALAGVYQAPKDMNESKIPIAIAHYLINNDNVEKIILHFDNDMAGRNATNAFEYASGCRCDSLVWILLLLDAMNKS